jgi:AraC-like DNA-binding protein
MMKHILIPPPPQLSGFIKCFWTFEAQTKDNNCLQISTFVKESSGITIATDHTKTIFIATLQGQVTQPQVLQTFSSLQALGVQFYPQAAHVLFGIDALELTNQEIQLNDVAGWNIADAIFNAPDINARLRILTSFLTCQAKKAALADDMIQGCIYHISAKIGQLTVYDLVEEFAISERQLERRFMSAIGVSPRHFLKVTRFGEAINLLKSTDTIHLTDVAHTLNYSDQSHFIRHVKQLSGFTPAVLQKKLRELPVNQAGSTPYLLEAL